MTAALDAWLAQRRQQCDDFDASTAEWADRVDYRRLTDQARREFAALEAAASLIEWMALDSVARVEALAEAFYYETGMIAPGKDAPAAMGGQDPAVRRGAYRAWIDALNVFWEARVAAAAAAFAKLPEPA